MSTLPTWAEYVRFTDETAAYPGVNTRGTVPRYVRDGLRAEIGEVYGVLARVVRDNGFVWTDERRHELLKEIGDVIWFCARWSIHDRWDDDNHAGVAEIWTGPWHAGHPDADEALDDVWNHAWHRCVGDVLESLSEFAANHGLTLQECAAENIAKLRDRKARGVIQGKGDTR